MVAQEIWYNIQELVVRLVEKTGKLSNKELRQSAITLHDSVFSVSYNSVTREQLETIKDVTLMLMEGKTDPRIIDVMLRDAGLETIPSDKTKEIYSSYLAQRGN